VKSRGACRFGLAWLAARRIEDVRHTNAYHVKRQHRGSKEAHAHRVGQRADDGRDDEDDEDGIADVADEELRIDDTEDGEEEDKDWKLEGDAEAEDNGEEEARIIVDGDDGVEAPGEVGDEHPERTWKNPVISEPDAGEKQSDRCRHEGDDVSLLLRVHAGGDEQPELIEDEGRG
jgi:hypothetical protein